MFIEDILEVKKLKEETNEAFVFTATAFGEEFNYLLLKKGGETLICEKGIAILAKHAHVNYQPPVMGQA